jgi:hypothetical protein
LSIICLKLRTEQEKEQLTGLLNEQIEQELEQSTVSLLALGEEQMEQEQDLLIGS